MADVSTVREYVCKTYVKEFDPLIRFWSNMKQIIKYLITAGFLGLLICIIIWWPQIRNEFFVLLGSRNETGGWYGFHSGMGGAAYITIVPAAILLYWHHTCHINKCFRPGRHLVDGTKWCNKHHIAARRKLAETGSAHDLGLGLNSDESS